MQVDNKEGLGASSLGSEDRATDERSPSSGSSPSGSVSHGAWTRGPWVFHKRGQRIYGGSTQNVHIAQMQIGPTWEANARLIAAAPCLYEALAGLLERMAATPMAISLEEWSRISAPAMAALARARGK